MIKHWPKVSSRLLADFRIFSVRCDSKISPRTGQPHDVFVLDCPDWVNVVALTPDQDLVMIEQYRHGSNTVELEIPGGAMDPRDTSPIQTGVRELREETGYQGETAEIIGRIFPNPAIMSNLCYTVLAQNCRLQHPTELDDGEDLATRLVPAAEIPELIAAGKIRHSLMVVGLYFLELRQRKRE